MIVANEINYSSLIQIHNKKIVKPTVKLNCWIIEQLKLNFIGVTTAVSLLDDVNWHGCQKRKYFDVGNGFFSVEIIWSCHNENERIARDAVRSRNENWVWKP